VDGSLKRQPAFNGSGIGDGAERRDAKATVRLWLNQPG
jgi:hypothetical protein